MEAVTLLNQWMDAVNAILWHDYVLFTILGVGILFLFWSRFGPLVALTHGVQVVLGKYDNKNDPGAISHFQALSAALSATVGLGNIGGVAVAIALGGPGAVFWMWVVGFIGMAIKMTEVTQSMLYRNTSDPENPHGGPMWVVKNGLRDIHPKLHVFGGLVGSIFCVTLLISTITGGNMFQAWSVGDVTQQNFGVPPLLSGIVMAVVCAMVIIGGIKRIGQVAGTLVPFMCGVYIIAGVVVLLFNIERVPEMFALIISAAFNPLEAEGAFIGGTFGYAFLWGMKRALFSNEAGQGSAPIAHSAAKTSEPVREGIVAGLEPFIDTLVVCTLTALVILSSGVWNRSAAAHFNEAVTITEVAPQQYQLVTPRLPTVAKGERWSPGQSVYMVIDGHPDRQTGTEFHRVFGTVVESSEGLVVQWSTFVSVEEPALRDQGIWIEYASASLTSHAFDQTFPGLGRWMITLAAWLFAISTMISWSYYGEQGVIFLLGERAILPYKLVYCLLIVFSTSGIITTTNELDNLTGIGTGVMLFANIPIMLIFARRSMAAYHEYVGRLRRGELG
jgi:alanine or glycine:cation symporter, AGCS family